MSTLLRDIFTIPDHTSTADYVLRLTESVDDAHLRRTIADYVVTPELARSFDTALSVVADAIATNTSKGAFLTGSFGSGKSHFMAVLYALLRQVPEARALPDLAGPIRRHDPQLQGRRILPLTFHMLGATSMEQALFDGYLRQIKHLHPDATPPLLHQASRLLTDAENLRQRIGDEAFFAGLNEGSGGGGDIWGGVLGDEATWIASSYEAARASSNDDESRAELVAALQKHYFSGYTSQATHVGLDEGLTAISAHAQSLGYDAVVLFLDELVLWLAFRIRDVAFFGAESQKLTKLVEGGQGGRRIPLVSFVARQMDLRRWLADAGANGAEQATLAPSFNLQEGRFIKIRLGDDNLPYVAHKRLLTPKDADADAEIQRAFDQLDRRSAAWDTLLDGANTEDGHRAADAAQFRLTYPFSPALMSTLRSLAGVMQRERTALKVMQQMLVDGRDTLTIDDVIPVGDAFDYLVTGAAGDQPLDEAAAALFRAARSLFEDRLLPIILDQYGLTVTDFHAGADRPPALRADLRLAKTLMLSAVAPNVPALKGLTANRLAALNHGSIVSPLPNGEASVVLAKVRTWSTRIPEIRVESGGSNPLITVQLSDVDYESIVERARGEDNDGRRRDLVKHLVSEAFGLTALGPQDYMGGYSHRVVWRGSMREVGLVFGNVRDAGWLTDEHFRAAEGTWKFVIDHPFDEVGHSAAEDHARIDALRARNWDEHTIVWLPRFFTAERMKDVSRLVVLNYLLEGSGDRYASYADHLSETGRVQARLILQAQREALRHSVSRAIQVAYDVESPLPGNNDVVNDVAHPDVLSSLTPTFTPRPPAGGTLQQAFQSLVNEAFASTYPGHPRFEPGDTEVKSSELSKVYAYVEQALNDKEGRIPLGPDYATIRRVANPLGVGKAAETHYLFGDDYFGTWGPEFERHLGARDGDGNGPVTVGEVRGWIRGIEPALGLSRDVQDLVILAWAALRRRAWFAHGAPLPTPKPGGLRDEMELRVQPMPSAEEWASATRLAGAMFGVAASPYVTPAEVAKTAAAVHDKAVDWSQPSQRLVAAIDKARHALRMGDAPASGRLATASATADLREGLRGLQGLPLIERLAKAWFADPQQAGRSLESASKVADLLDRYPWNRFEPLFAAAKQEGAHADQAAGILRRLRESLDAEELVVAIGPALKQAEDELFEWMRQRTPIDPNATIVPKPKPVQVSGQTRFWGRQGAAQVQREIDAFVTEHQDAEIHVKWWVE